MPIERKSITHNIATWFQLERFCGDKINISCAAMNMQRIFTAVSIRSKEHCPPDLLDGWFMFWWHVMFTRPNAVFTITVTNWFHLDFSFSLRNLNTFVFHNQCLHCYTYVLKWFRFFIFLWLFLILIIIVNNNNNNYFLW